jgi:2-polyprenyl-6-methoxyphenol hydroxylase-like FAD-dependent oxidoreductase
MHEIYGRYHAPIGALLEHTDPPAKVNVFEIAMLPRWHRGRVVLVGDAAHAVSPSAGQGASLALEDAMTLAMQLRDAGSDHRRAFAEFERDRLKRVGRVAAEARRHGDGLPVTALRSFGRSIRRWAGLNLFGERDQDWMYRYRVDWSGAAPTARSG